MPQLNTVFARARQMPLQAIRTPANTLSEDWSFLSPAAVGLLLMLAPERRQAHAQPNHANART